MGGGGGWSDFPVRFWLVVEGEHTQEGIMWQTKKQKHTLYFVFAWNNQNVCWLSSITKIVLKIYLKDIFSYGERLINIPVFMKIYFFASLTGKFTANDSKNFIFIGRSKTEMQVSGIKYSRDWWWPRRPWPNAGHEKKKKQPKISFFFRKKMKITFKNLFPLIFWHN